MWQWHRSIDRCEQGYGVRAAICHDAFSARQGVEDDDLCLGGRTTGIAVAWDCVKSFLTAKFTGAERHLRRLAKVRAIGTNPMAIARIPMPMKSDDSAARGNGQVKQ